MPFSRIAKRILDLSTNARMRRAREMGFDEQPVFHGTAKSFDAFDLSRGGTTSQGRVGQLGVSVTDDPAVASEFASLAARGGGAPSVLPLRIRAKRRGVIELDGTETDLEIAATVQGAWDEGFDAIKFLNYTTPAGQAGKSLVLVRAPSQIRSVNAAFDPANRVSPSLLAGGAAAALGLGTLLAPKEGAAAVPGNPFAQELQRRRQNPFQAELQRRQQPTVESPGSFRTSGQRPPVQSAGTQAPVTAQRQPSFGEAFGRAAATQYISNLLGGLQNASGRDVMAAKGPEFMARDPSMTLPSAEQVVAGVETAAQVPGAVMQGEPINLGGRFGAQMTEAERVAAARPGATTAGEVSGDIATLLTGRLPIRGAVTRMQRAPATKPPVPPGLRRQLDDITKKVIATNMPRGLRRAAETGLEGAVLAVLDEGDPAQTAALAAGSQAAGSLFLTLAKPLVTSKAGLLGTIALGTVGLQLFKESTPGGQDRILESVETSIFKVLPTVALGTLSAAAGFGRVKGRFQENLPKIADAITAIPRGALVSLLKDLAKDEGQGGSTALVLEKFNEDPTYFGPGAMVRIQRALRNGKSLSAEVQSMMRNEDFRKLVDELD